MGQRAIVVALVFVATLAALKFDGALARRGGGVPLLATAPGVVLALLLVFWSLRWLLAGAALAGALAATLFTTPEKSLAIVTAGVVVLMPLLAAHLLRPGAGPKLRLERLDQVFRLIGIAAIGCTGLGALAWSGAARGAAVSFADAFRVRWIADGLGILVAAPLLLMLHAMDWRALMRLRPGRVLEALLVSAGLAWCTAHSFARLDGSSEPSFVGRYTALALLVWAALRFSLRGGAIGIAIVAAVVLRSAPIHESALSLQLFLFIAAVQTLVVGAMAAERLEVERLSRDNEARYRAQIEHAPEAIVVLDCDTGRFIDQNPAAERLFGMSAGQLARIGPVDLSPPAQPDGRPSAEAARSWIEQALDGGTPTFEWMHRDAHGRERLCEVRLLRLPSSSRRLVRGSITDISERKQADAALRRSEASLKVAQRVGGVGSWHVDVPRDALEWSEECYRIFGRDPATFRPTNAAFFASVHPDDLAAVQAASRRSLETGEPYGIEHRIVLPDGAVRHVLEHAEIERDATGKVVAMVGTTQDVTERKLLQQQLLQSQKLESVGRLAGGVAHDFNNLLTVIRGGAELLLARLGADDPARADVQEIEMAARRATDLTRQLLSFARRQFVEPKLFDLAELAADMDKLLRRVLGEDVELVFDAAPGLWSVKADRGQLEQVLMNLAVNARDAMPGGGRLTIRVENAVLDRQDVLRDSDVVPGPHVRLTVTDTGTGMSPESLAHLFEPFFTTKDVGKGTGLGLASVHGIVKQAGGTVSVRSEPGQGTAFTILLPRASGEPEPAAAAEQASLPRGSESILLVEDDRQLREMATRVLESCGYDVVAVASGDAAKSAAGAAPRPFDLLVTDMVLPRTSGREVADSLRSRWPSLRVLCISGYTEDETFRREVVERGGAWLAKPFTAAALARRVRETIDGAGDGAA